MSDASHLQWSPLSGPLGAEQLGDPRGPKVVFLHGFTQTRNSWKPLAEQVAAAGNHTVVIDLPGHGDSGGVRADLRRTADMVAAIGGPGTYVGYSLGGRAALHLALMYPHLTKSVVLIGATAGIADADERARRREADDVIETRMAEIGLDAFLREWVTQPLFSDLVVTDEDLADRRRNTVEGLTSSLRLAGSGAQTSLWPRLREINSPVLAIAGERDEKFAALAEQIAAAIPQGRALLVPNAGHAAHLQQPVFVLQSILAAVAPV
ncbi:MAG: alpha/beta fold hydrolase [Actinomycetia bacterium]|nr:alpha/beta fold hydrolase [Actinomycetes bacterium]